MRGERRVRVAGRQEEGTGDGTQNREDEERNRVTEDWRNEGQDMVTRNRGWNEDEMRAVKTRRLGREK